MQNTLSVSSNKAPPASPPRPAHYVHIPRAATDLLPPLSTSISYHRQEPSVLLLRFSSSALSNMTFCTATSDTRLLSPEDGNSILNGLGKQESSCSAASHNGNPQQTRGAWRGTVVTTDRRCP